MGTQKLLLPYSGSTVIGRVVDAFLQVGRVCPHTAAAGQQCSRPGSLDERRAGDSGALPESAEVERVCPHTAVLHIDAVFVVIRGGDSTVHAALAPRTVHFIENPSPEADMLSSVRCGIRALPPGCSTVCVSPGDQPALAAPELCALLAAAAKHPGRILVPTHEGRRGHPLVFPIRYSPEILTSFDGVGLRGLLHAYASEVIEWEAGTASVLQDLDTPEDYRGALRRNEAR